MDKIANPEIYRALAVAWPDEMQARLEMFLAGAVMLRPFEVTMRDRAGAITREFIEVENEMWAWLLVCPDDKRLCRNPYVVLARADCYDRQIMWVRFAFERIHHPVANPFVSDDYKQWLEGIAPEINI